MKTSTVVAGMSVMVLLLPGFRASAVETLSTAELAKHCSHYNDDPGGKHAIFCVRYVQGFIDGAVATDERVTHNLVNEYEDDPSYRERALRTRSPVLSLGRYGATVYADFCLGAPVPLEKVVEHVVRDLDNRKVVEDQLNARDAVYSILRRDFPCQREDDE